MRDLLNFIRPPEDASWKHVNRWRWNVCLTLMVLVVSLILGLTRYRVAFANEVDSKIATAVAAAAKPLIEAQARADKRADRIESLLISSLANTKAAEIRLTINKRCKTTGYVERDELLREKERLQREYFNLMGEYYKEPSCSEL